MLLRIVILAAVAAVAARAEDRQGSAEYSFQSFFLGGSERAAQYTVGPATRFSYFSPRYGLLHGNVAPFVADGKLRGAETYVGLKGLPWAGRLWSFTAGDFRQTTRPAKLRQSGVYWPDFRLWGGQASAASGATTYTAFGGQVAVMEGARVTVTRPTTQRVAGVEAVRDFSDRLRAGVRMDRVSGGGTRGQRNKMYLPEERRFEALTEAVGHVTYEPRKGLMAYGELSGNSSRRVEGAAAAGASRWGAVAGFGMESERLDVRGSYLRQGTAYMPLVGQYAGDRQGAQFEARYQVWRGVGVFGSASRYANNIERDPGRTNFSTDSASGGVTANLPGRVNVLAQWSAHEVTIRPPGLAEAVTRNQQVFVSAGRAVQRHQVRVNLREMRTQQPGRYQQLQSVELQDTYVAAHWNGGGAVRVDQALGVEPKTSVVYRGFFNGQFGRLNAFFNAELGNDLLSRSIFAASAFRTTGGGVGLRLKSGWLLSAEAMRTNLRIDLNPANAFFLATQGVQASTLLAASNQWQAYLRLSHTVQWGAVMAREVDAAGAAAGLPLTGAVEGFVNIEGMDPAAPAPGVAVLLDGQRPAVADDNGRFRFEEVPQGEHVVQLHLRELPAEFNPADIVQARVTVLPRKTARAEFRVVQLGVVEGVLAGPAGMNPGGVMVRMRPGNEYAAADEAGRFAFYNVRPGAYELSVEEETLPAGVRRAGDAAVAVVVKPGKRQTVQVALAAAEARGPVRRRSLPAISVEGKPPARVEKKPQAAMPEVSKKPRESGKAAPKRPAAKARKTARTRRPAEKTVEAAPAPRVLVGADGQKVLFVELPRARKRVAAASARKSGALVLDGGKVLD